MLLRRGVSLLAAIAGTVVVGLAPAAATVSSRPAPSSAPAGPAPVADRPEAKSSADEIITGVGQTDGFHLYVARSSQNWAWEPVALLDPGGNTGQSWLGNTCLTGDGRTAVAVVAPWSTVNSVAGLEHGGIAYGVDLATGRAQVLATGVSMAYFDPGCGTGADVALTSYQGDAEQATRVERVDAATGTTAATATLSGEFTSAVPVAGALMAAHGDQLVRLTAQRATPAATLPGQVFQLRPNQQDGVDLLSQKPAAPGSAWRYSRGSLRQVGAGPAGTLSLLSGHDGRTVLAGGSRVTRIPGLTAVPVRGSQVLAASDQGSALLLAPARSGRTPSQLPEIASATGQVLRAAAALPRTAVPRTTSMAAGAVTRARITDKAAATPAPACAVGRDDPAIQVPQPTNAQIDWAIQRAVTNSLPSRSAGFDNLPGGSYSPEADFPQAALTGGGSLHVPALVVAGILAQESNFSQASWHAPAGTAGDPLVGDYYGNGGSSASIDYTRADCGYGLGQITDIMNAGNSVGLAVQQRVAVDYTENIAAVVQHLAATWNQLAAYSPSITVNNGNPAWLEDWYDTIWAYNSGVEPRSAAYGLPAGCAAAGPGCTDSAGNWGLGWANNPINPVFKPGRPVFLSDSYADAATPSEWPYQERVFGWMATPLLRYDSAYGGEEDAYPPATQYLKQPPVTAFCSLAVDKCDPSDSAKLYCGYQAAGALQYHCWWNGPVSFAENCDGSGSGVCTADRTVSNATSEPATDDPDPPACNLDTSQVPLSTPAGQTVVVTEESGAGDPGGSDINVVGCAGGRNWSAAGSFKLNYAQDGQGQPLGQVDFHQLGAGFGGHMFFAHTVPPSAASTNQVVGTWSPGLSKTGIYQIKVFVPDIGAAADPAVYTVTSSNGRIWEITINQNDYGNQWVSLGDFSLGASSTVSLTNVTANGDYTSDLAYAAMAFIPRPGRLVQHTIDGFSNFGDTQSLNSAPPASWITGDFASDSSLTQMASNLTSGLLAYPACTSAPDSQCVPSGVRTAMTTWQSAVNASNGHPVQWLGFSRPTPPNPLPASYLDTGTNYKVRASTDIQFLVGSNGQIDPSSYTVTATNSTGITELPQFILQMFTSLASGYGVSQPDLSYSATNLQDFNGASTAVNPLGTGLAPGREYLPDLSVQLTSNNTCLQVQDLAGGSIGWKTLLTDDNVVQNASAWRSAVDSLVSSGRAPQALATLADTVIKDFFTRPLQWGVIPWPGDGSIFYYAPPIWVETHFNDCVSGSGDTISPAGSVDPDTNRAQLVDNSYMPDLYLAIDGTFVDKYGSPSGGAPVQTGDWPDFAASPGQASPFPSPWNLCYIGPSVTTPTGDTIPFISRRDGNPWNLPMLSPADLSSNVSFC